MVKMVLMWGAILLFTLTIHTADSLSYALRLGGLRARRIGLALSLAGMLLLVSRTSNMAQGPMIGRLVDHAKSAADGGGLASGLHIVMAAAAAGTVLAMLLFPSVVRISARLVVHLESAGSFPALLRRVLIPARLKNISFYIRLPRLYMVRTLLDGNLPRRLMVMNMTVTAIYTTGVLSSLYASYLWPAHSTSMSMSSGLINGLATILLTLLIDPKLAILSERSLRGELRLSQMNRTFGLMMCSRLAGTLLAQLLLVPFAYWLGWLLG
ncbi:DUF2837 family protein [Paenibacillus sp. JX-17]|uniref:Lipid II flippase Amj n=1 Tax=Paenibacillus lacisoli TaxID=3064525 RepID=A0ABT9CC02_9BACL|nr:DUF2837 family protein [Paenibacillus sp. JX-17]MDO7905216.1 DUF2837 family protein [Paenibacillus sp. JX-17]